MCPPTHFDVTYEINPWMRRDNRPDPDRAWAQWDHLVSVLCVAGAAIETVDPVRGLPDMVFTANAGFVDDRTFIVSRFMNPERRPEAGRFVDWFRPRGYAVCELDTSPEARFEGGEVCPFRGRLLGGYGFRSHPGALEALGAALAVEVLPIRLVDPRLYHLDACFCPLDERRAILAPNAFDGRGRELLSKLVPEPLLLEADEALAFCANSVVVGTCAIMPACPPRVGRILERWGYDVAVVDVSEFLKAGGAARCLTLPLDISLERMRANGSEEATEPA